MSGGGPGSGAGASGGGDFGRDEMNQLLGGGLSERLLAPRGAASAVPPGAKRGSSAAKKGKDVADMTAAEAAAYLLEKQAHKKGAMSVGAGHHDHNHAVRQRHRATKVRQYHQLLAEQIQDQQRKQSAAAPKQDYQQEQQADESSSSEEEDESTGRGFGRRTGGDEPFKQRSVPAETEGARRRPRYYDSDDDDDRSKSSDGSSQRKRRRTGRARADSSSSSSSEDDDNRRQRLLERRRLQQSSSAAPVEAVAEIKDNAANNGHKHTLDEKSAAPPRNESSAIPTSKHEPANKTNKARMNNSSSSSKSSSSSSSGKSSSSSSSSDDSSSGGSDDDESEPDPPTVTPIVFVPKHRRHLPASQRVEAYTAGAVDDEEDEEERVRRRQRQQESRALVQQVVLEGKSASSARDNDGGDDAFEGVTGARNAIPSDSDDDHGGSDGEDHHHHRRQRRDDWEVRELLRLLRDIDVEEERIREATERERRRNMTDEEIMREREALEGGNKRDLDDARATSHRYFHKGAFFLDDSEWAQNDVRHRAEEYARAATEADQVDQAKLPKVMQTKKFGRANQSKYQGLAKEDTTDRTVEFLPLAPNRPKAKR
jgi:microfibrillar-associated protein 1